MENPPMTQLQPINPFYARRQQRFTARAEERPQPRYARLPLAPKNASPVPHLTSLYHFHRAGEYGSRQWPGNCGGNLIRDVLMYFRLSFAMDPMAGSGTCADVCKELCIPCMSYDIHQDFDACNPKEFAMVEMFDFIWAHPAYWRQKLYLDSPKDLSRSPTLEHFLKRYGQFIQNAARALKPGGKLCILMGDYSDIDAGFVPLTWHTKRLAFEAGLRQHCTDIIRFSHGASSSKKVYRSVFIPGLHDTLAIFEKASVPPRNH
jgi:SAM-dependent methyltransferase